ncbi:MAG: PhoU domain-containing protein [Candidatus Woesearchaeota archaeon]
MHIRRLVKAGQASHTVSLPKNWLEKNNLKKGDIVYLKEISDKEIAIRPDMQEQTIEQKEITIEIDKKELDTVQREITAAYLNNYSTINLLGESIAEKTKEIRKLLHDFVALEITEQTSKRIVAKDLLNLKEISVDKTIKRMDMIARTMLEDTIAVINGKEVHESIIFRDFDINKLYFLLTRLLKSATKNNATAESICIKKEDILPIWYLAINLENLADDVKRICELIKEIDQKSLTNVAKVIHKISQSYTEAMKAYHSSNKELADKTARQRAELVKECSGLIMKNSPAELVELVENLKAISTIISNIARITIDKDISD